MRSLLLMMRALLPRLLMRWVRRGMTMFLLGSVLVLLMMELLPRLLMMWEEGAWRAGNVAGAVPAATDEGAAAAAAAERGHMECMALLPPPLLLLLPPLLPQALAGLWRCMF